LELPDFLNPVLNRPSPIHALLAQLIGVNRLAVLVLRIRLTRG